ncbi:MAG: carbohydrate-binding protein, partial [Bacteroidota bacterium]
WNYSGLGQGTWGPANDYQQLTNKYQSVKNWSVTNNIPVHHSEFGAIHACDFNSRMRIYAHNVEQCIVNGFAFSVWDDGGDFGILNRSNNTWPEVKDVLMHYHEDSPNQIFSTLDLDPVTNAPSIVVDWNNRATGNGNFLLERSVGGTSNFVQIADLPPTATTFTDTAVETGKTYTYRMYTNRGDGTLLHGYPTRLRIIATIQSPFNLAIPIPGKLEVEEYDNGGEGLAYHDSEPANIPAGFRLDEGVDIGANGSAYILEYVASGEWIEYTVDVAQAGRYSVKAEVASEVANGTFSLSFENNNATTTFTAPNTGGWVNFQTISATEEIELVAGEQQMRLSITNGNPFNVDHLTFTLESANSIALGTDLSEFTVFPNPAKDLLQIELSESFRTGTSQLLLYTLAGEEVAAFSVQGSSTTLEVSNLPRGVYLLHLVGEERRLIRRVMVQ